MKNRYDAIVEVNKFNPYHDERGRFSSANSAASFTYSPGKSKAHDAAIERERERMRDADEAARENAKKQTAIIPGEKVKIQSTYTRASSFQQSRYKDEVLEASISDDGSRLTFGHARATFVDQDTPKTNKQRPVEFEIAAGSVNGTLHNIDLNNANLKAVSGQTYSIKDQIKAAGFRWDSSSKEWVKKSLVEITEIE